MPTEIDPANKFLVAVRGGRMVILNPPRGPIHESDALNLAAWLVAVSMQGREEFLRVLDAVENT